MACSCRGNCGNCRQSGGPVVGPSHTNGGVPFINKSTNEQYELEGGEFVMRKDAVNKYGVNAMEKINNMSADPNKVRQLGNGGRIGRNNMARSRNNRRKMMHGGRTHASSAPTTGRRTSRPAGHMGGRTTCPPGQHMMPPTNGRPGYCMNNSAMPGNRYATGGTVGTVNNQVVINPGVCSVDIVYSDTPGEMGMPGGGTSYTVIDTCNAGYSAMMTDGCSGFSLGGDSCECNCVTSYARTTSRDMPGPGEHAHPASNDMMTHEHYMNTPGQPHWESGHRHSIDPNMEGVTWGPTNIPNRGLMSGTSVGLGGPGTPSYTSTPINTHMMTGVSGGDHGHGIVPQPRSGPRRGNKQRLIDSGQSGLALGKG